MVSNQRQESAEAVVRHVSERCPVRNVVTRLYRRPAVE